MSPEGGRGGGLLGKGAPTTPPPPARKPFFFHPTGIRTPAGLAPVGLLRLMYYGHVGGAQAAEPVLPACTFMFPVAACAVLPCHGLCRVRGGGGGGGGRKGSCRNRPTPRLRAAAKAKPALCDPVTHPVPARSDFPRAHPPPPPPLGEGASGGLPGKGLPEARAAHCCGWGYRLEKRLGRLWSRLWSL